MDVGLGVCFLGGMAKTFREWDLDQTLMFPPSLRDLVPEGHLAHFVRDTTVEALDLSAILGEYDEERGYPPYHPAMMTALLLYAYCQGIYSSRRIMKACEERVDFMAVTGMQKPDFRTINDFRKRHLRALGGLFAQVLRLCQRQGLVKLGHVALDSTRIKANASKHKAMSYARMKQAEPQLAAIVKDWLAKADATDRREDAEFGADRRGDELPDWVKNKQKRLEKIREARAALEQEAQAAAEDKSDRSGPEDPPSTPQPRDAAQRNFTDPESRIMKGPDGFVQAYSGHVAVDAHSQVIVAQTLTNNAADVTQLPAIVAQIKSNTGKQTRELSADAGYCSEANLKELSRRRIRAYIATGRHQHDATAPVSARRRYNTRVLAMQRKLRCGGHRSRYRLRKQVAEPVIGQVKHARGFRQCVLRGLEKVAGEWSLVCTAHNLLKLARQTAPAAT